jgi:hypothetical protein
MSNVYPESDFRSWGILCFGGLAVWMLSDLRSECGLELRKIQGMADS